MALSFQIDTLDGLDDVIATMYKKKGDKYVLDIDGLPEVKAEQEKTSEKTTPEIKRTAEDVRILSETLAKVRDEKRQAIKDLARFKDIDPEKVVEQEKKLQAFLEKEAEFERKEAEKRGDWERLEQELIEKNKALVEQHSKELEAIAASKENELKAMESSLINNMLMRDMTEAIAKAKGNIELLTPHVLKALTVVKLDDGSYATRVVDDNKTVRTDEIGKPLTIEHLLSELKEKPAFSVEGVFEKEKVPGGSGSQGNTNKNDDGVYNPWAKKTLNLTDQAAIMKKDSAQAARLKAAAGA